MNTQDFTTSLLVDQNPEEVYNAINRVRDWWSEAIEGETDQEMHEFTYRYQDLHYSRQRIIEMVPGKKVVWLVIDSHLSFTEKKNEWMGTRIHFEIQPQGDKTEIRFLHEGLIRGLECFQACSDGWTYYLNHSLFHLITTGKGVPDPKGVTTAPAP